MTHENRIVYAIPERAYDNANLDDQDEPLQGIYKVLFEECQGDKVKTNVPINSVDFFDEPAEIFIANGYSKIKRSSPHSMVRISVKKNESDSSLPNHKAYIGYHQYAKTPSQEAVCSFYNLALPDPHHPMVVLPYAPITRYIYIVDNGTAFGPFVVSHIEDTGVDSMYEINPPAPTDFKNSKGLIGSVFKFDYETALTRNDIVESDGYCVSFNPSAMLAAADKEVYEYLTPTIINAIVNGAIKDHSGSKKRQTNTVLAVKAIDSIKSSALSLSIRQNIKNHLTKLNSANWDKDLINAIYSIVADSKDGNDILQAAYKDKKDELHLSWLGEFEKKSTKILENIRQLETERSDLQSEVDNIKRELLKETDRLKNAEATIVGANGEVLSQEDALRLKNELKSITEELETAKTEYHELKEIYGKYKTLDQLQKKTSDQEAILNYNNEKLAQLKDSMQSTKELLNKDEKELQKTLRSFAPFVSTLIQAPMPVEDTKYSLEPVEGIITTTDSTVSDLQNKTVDFLAALQARLSSQHNRNITISDLASILVAQNQSFLSIFSGPPGVGKTSFYRILQNILKQGEYSLEVPVGKGWISERELIGFFNSLTEKFAAAPSGIYQYLKAIEDLKANEVPPTTILLDEANLSPIEQYWAPFLVMADSDSDRVLRLTNDSIKLPSTLRFVGTTNHDMTTEPLSARLIDRAPIIPMDMIFNDDDEHSVLNDKPVPIYSADTLERMFGASSVFSSDMLNESLLLLEKIYDILQNKDAEYGQRFIISQRKKQNIESYISVLGSLLARTVGSDISLAEKTAIDYAILYFLLPMISGTGEQLGNRLNVLLLLVEQYQLSLSACKLKDMIARSKYTLDTFSFFQY